MNIHSAGMDDWNNGRAHPVCQSSFVFSNLTSPLKWVIIKPFHFQYFFIVEFLNLVSNASYVVFAVQMLFLRLFISYLLLLSSKAVVVGCILKLTLSKLDSPLQKAVKIDGREVGDGQVGPVTRRLQNAYKKLTEESGVPIPSYQEN
ncbi:hypothetical protein POTOM_020534 [Populus tomentosa]|uniref:Uncharacterized protein n=1 Tax=Populus tomentosa TaxID=118781 RepID=A0A8X8D0L8_POPTO|nr:hypothetical protein POTOM_020534 [Populus tomentosa]